MRLLDSNYGQVAVIKVIVKVAMSYMAYLASRSVYHVKIEHLK